MRLTCPNCRAQYDVPDTAIPEDGRDVECSNCAHSWFQSPDPGPGPLTLGEEALVPPNAPPPRSRKLDPELEAVLRDEALRESRARATDGGRRPPTKTPANLAPPRPDAPPNGGQTNGASQTQGKAQGSAQDATTTPPEQTPQAPSAPPPASPAPAEPKVPPTPRRRESAGRADPFPDVEEINSTLRSASERRGLKPKANKAASKTASSDSSAAAQGKAASSEQPPVPQASASQKRSKDGEDVAPQSKAAKTGVTASAPPSRYGEGTIWGLCLAMAIVAVYLAAPWITNQIPGSAVWIAPFAEGIDAARLWMSEIVEAGGADGV